MRRPRARLLAYMCSSAMRIRSCSPAAIPALKPTELPSSAQLLAEAVQHLLGLGGIGADQHEEELVAANAEDDVVLAH